MDVRCERCNTEYEFDEDRITEAGVAVRCTQCDHVFMVKKHSVVVTGPVPEGVKGPFSAADTPRSGSSPAAPLRDPAERSREWKVRQPNGNLITFKELTTLQKWIVERKVSRDDEISLTGESWKRLGNIPELSSFFQVVDEAQRAARPPEKPAGARAVERGMTPPTGVPVAEPGKPPTPPQAIPPVVVSLEESIERTPAIPEPSSSRASAAAGSARFDADIAHVRREPSFALSAPIAPLRDESDDALAAAAGLLRGPRRQWRIVLFVALLGLVSYLAYRYFVWIPERQRQERVEAADRESLARAEQQRVEQERAERERAEQERAERERAERERAVQEQAARARAASTKTAEAATDAPPKSEAADPEEKPEAAAPLAKAQPEARSRQSTDRAAEDPSVPAPLLGSRGGGRTRAAAKIEEADNFDSYMNLGDRFREREQPRNALDAYAKAAELEPGRVEPLAGRGLALLDLGRTAPAIAAFQQALKLNPRHALALMGLAEAYRVEGKNDEAITYYEKYLDVLPDGPEAAVAKAAIKALQE